MKNVVELRGLHKRFGTRQVFDGLDLHVAAGEVVAVLGPSGCGKSTLLRCIAGLIKADGGWVYVNGEPGFMFQEPRLFPWLSVRKNVGFGTRNDAERARIDDMLALVGLHDAGKLLPKALSGGMAQRVALARTLVRNPSLLLLDEPLAALDALRRLELQAALRAIITEQKLSAILVTHDVDEALVLADRIIVLSGGSPARKVAEFTRDADRAELLAALGVAPPALSLHLDEDRVFVRAILGEAETEDVDRDVLHALVQARVPYADLTLNASDLSFSVPAQALALVRAELARFNVALRVQHKCTRIGLRGGANTVGVAALIEVLERAGVERLYAAESGGAVAVLVRSADLPRVRASLEESFGIIAA